MTKQMKRTNKLTKSIMGSAIGCALALSGWAVVHQAPVATVNVEANQTLTDFESAIMQATDTAKDAVVSIKNKQAIYVPDYYRGTFRAFDGSEYNGADREESDEAFEPELETAGEGSGVIYKTEGGKSFIVTNEHVISGAKELEVILSDGTTAIATVVGHDALTDLAVLTIESSNVKSAIKFADSSQLRVGQLAIAIGSPLGSEYSNSVTQGIVSGLNRTMEADADGDGNVDGVNSLLQTDAAINPGNSGGALVNKNGELIGINVIKYSSVAIEGMGFAIPSNEVQTVIAQLEQHGEIMRPVLGIRMKEVSVLSERARGILQLPDNVTTGLAIAEVISGSSADKSGIQQYDVIIRADNQDIQDATDLKKILNSHVIGDKIEVTVLREGKEVTMSVTLEGASSNPLDE